MGIGGFLTVKKFISIIVCFFVTALLFTGCGNDENKNNDTSSNSSYESDNASKKIYTPDEYLLARNIFVDKYKVSISKMQKVISGFDFSEECWVKYRELRNEINSISDTFFSNESMISDKNLDDFKSIKEQVHKYSDIINKIEEYRGKNADEQAAIIAESIKNMNRINLNWKSKEEATS